MIQIDKDYLFFYILGIIFTIALLIISFEKGNFNVIQWILILCVGTIINVLGILHLSKEGAMEE